MYSYVSSVSVSSVEEVRGLTQQKHKALGVSASPPTKTASIKRKHRRGEWRLRRLEYSQISWEIVCWTGGEWMRRYSARPHPFLQQACGLISKDNVNEFSSISDSSFMASMDSNLQQCTIERKQRDCAPGSHQSVMQLRPHSLITLQCTMLAIHCKKTLTVFTYQTFPGRE